MSSYRLLESLASEELNINQSFNICSIKARLELLTFVNVNCCHSVANCINHILAQGCYRANIIRHMIIIAIWQLISHGNIIVIYTKSMHLSEHQYLNIWPISILYLIFHSPASNIIPHMRMKIFLSEFLMYFHLYFSQPPWFDRICHFLFYYGAI